MTFLAALTAGALLMSTAAQAQQPNPAGRRVSPDQVRAVAPALEAHTQERLYGEIWRRPGLSPRDRSLTTIAMMIARGQQPALTYYADQALENGVAPREISETITHLAYYCGWGAAMAAIGPVGEVFARRGIGADQLPSATPDLAPIDAAGEARRAQTVSDQFAATSPELVGYTTDYLFKDLWLRPDLAPRDRSLITVAALIAAGQTAQIPFHLNRAMDNGLTQAQASEMITHLAFYAGWPSAMSALPAARDVFAARAAAR